MDFNITTTEVVLLIWAVAASVTAHHLYGTVKKILWVTRHILSDVNMREQMVHAYEKFVMDRKSDK